MFERIADPTQPYDPVIIARRRPVCVTAAGAALYGAGGVSVVAALALLIAAGPVVDDFRRHALLLGVTPADAGDIARGVRTVLLSGGCAALALALLTLPLARGVQRRSEAARIAALVVAGASLGCGLVRTSVTAFGASVDWSVATGRDDPAIGAAVAQAFAEAMPGWLAGLSGGLTDLQALGYLAVAALLVAPSSRQYFRTRVVWYSEQSE